MTSPWRSFLAAAILLAAVPLSAQSHAPRGKARIVRPPALRTGARVTVPVVIDLTPLSQNGQPVSLGAYVIRAVFDRSAVSFVEAHGGTTPFDKAPFATNAVKANVDALLKIAAVVTGAPKATGSLHVADLVFQEAKSGGIASVKITIESLSRDLPSAGSTSAGELKIAVEPEQR